MRRRRSSHGRLWLFQLRSECVGKFYQSLKNRGESELQKLNFNFGLIFWWLVNFTQEISYAFCQSLRFWVFTFEMWVFTFKGTLLIICGLCTAIVIQLPFVSMELLSNKFEVQWSPFLFFWEEHTDADHLLQLSRSNQPNCRLWQKWSTEIGARHKFRK